MEHTLENQAIETIIASDSMLAAGATQESVFLLEALKNSSIRFAHWKSNGHLLRSLEGKTDLDLLIHPDDRQAFERVMQQRHYKKLISQPWSSYPQVDNWIGMDEQTGNLLHIHTHYALVTGIRHVKHLYLPWVEEFFKQLTTDPLTGWPIPRPEMEALILFIRIWAKMPPMSRLKKSPPVPPYIQAELVELLLNADQEYFMALCRKLQLQVPANLSQQLEQITAKGNVTVIVGLAKHFYAQLRPHYRMSWPMALATSFFYSLLLRLLVYTSKYIGPVSRGKRLDNEGKVLALIGCDGSGKSTLSGDLLRWLTYKLDAHYFYLGKVPFIRSYQKLILAKEDLVFGSSWLSRGLKKVLGNFYFVVLIRRKVKMLQLARRMARKGSIVLCDRLPQQQTPGINDGPRLSLSADQAAGSLEQHYFGQASTIAADLVFRLQVSPETAAKRKPDHDIEIIKQKSQILSQLYYPQATIIDIDANQPYEQVLLNIKQEIWKHL